MTAWPAALETQGRHRPRFPFTDLADLRCKPILGSTLTHRALDACPCSLPIPTQTPGGVSSLPTGEPSEQEADSTVITPFYR